MKHVKIFILAFLLFLPNAIYAATVWDTAADGLSTTLQPSPYENNSNTSTTLSIAGATGLSITINGEVEAGYDFVYITDSTGNKLTFDGVINTTYVVTGASITIQFTSDTSVVKSGVTVSISSTTDNPTPPNDENYWNINTQRDTAILSPDPYLNAKDTTTETLTIAGASELIVTISGEIEDQNSCTYDYATIQDAAGNYTHPGTKNNRFCGLINQTFNVSGDYINIFFHADSSVQKSGVTITIADASPHSDPVANAGADQTINLGENLVLDGSLSSDSDGTIVDYTWYQGGVIIGTGVNYTLSGLGAGTHTFTLTVTDNDGLTHSDSVNVRVNTPPVANAGADINATTGETVILNGSASSDDNNAITYSWTEGTIPLNLTGVAPSVTFTTAGTYTITLTVTDDNGLISTDSVVVRVNTAPVAEDANFTVMQNSSVSFELNATDADGDTIVSFPIQTGPSHGTLSGPENNMTYTPDINYSGTDFFTYKAYDGTSYSNEATVYFTIIPPATARDDHFSTAYKTLLIGNVLENDSGLDITVTNSDMPANGTVNIGADGEFSYIPFERFDGNDTFTYTITDKFGNTSTATVTIFVYPPRNDMSIVKTAPAQSDVGLAMDYTLTISSASGDEYIVAENVRVTDRLPIGVGYSGFTAPSGWTCGHVSGTVSCDTSAIPPGYTGTIVIHATAPYILGDSTNTAEVGSDTIDPDLSNNTSSATTNVVGIDVDLSINKTVSSSTVNVTSPFSYSINVQNSGSADTTGVFVTDTLPAGLNFISIDGNGEWSCSQGSSINCSYIANSGTLAAGATTADIIINVTAPPVASTITNSADVASANLEVNTANNTDSVDVEITEGTVNPGAQIPLTKYLQYNFYGDMTLLGNANVNWNGVGTAPSYNDNANMVYVDTDSDASTFNSSSSTLSLGGDYNILWAGLYWEGHICSSDAAGVATGTNTGCDWSNSNFANYNQALPNIGTARLKTPNRPGYITINAHRVNNVQNVNVTNPDISYTAFADITNLINSNEVGTYTLANMVLTEGQIGNGGNYGGWTMLVLYEDANKTLQYKNISVFNGFQSVTTDNNPLAISGFVTPQSGTINASIAYFAADGDPVAGGVGRMLDANDNTFKAIGDTLNPTTNLFNSSMTQLGNNINPGVTTTYGVDADRINVSSFMTNDQSNTSFFFDVTTPTGGQDYYTLSMFAFATDLTTPLIDNFDKKAIIIGKDGTRRVAGPDEPIFPGSSLEYSITFTNTGDEVAEDVEIFDDFDFDGLTPALNTNFFDYTKLKLFEGSTATTEVSNPDCGYDIADRRVYCRLDSVAINQTFTMQFTVTLKDDLTSVLENNASNTAYAKYRNPNGNTYVEFYTTPITNEAVGGKSNSLNAGIFKPDDRGSETFISIDAINANYDYARDRNITTKIVNKPFDIQLVHKSGRQVSDGETPYQAWNQAIPMAVIVTDTNSTSTLPLNNPATDMFTEGMSSLVAQLNIPRAHRSDRLQMAYLDWNKILGWSPGTSACRLNSEFSTNLNGLPACFNDYIYVEPIFQGDTATIPAVAACYGKATPTTPANPTPPCNPLAYSTSGEPTGTITPEKYSHNFGCYQCITDAYPKFKSFSADNFAVRPDHFELSSDNPSFPDLLRAGSEYSLSIIARDGATPPSATLDYNTSTARLSMGDPVLDPQGLISVPLEGNTTLNKQTVNTVGDPVDSNISDGILVDENGNPDERISFSFDNVGDISAYIRDIDWASVDAHDTPSVDCNDTSSPVNFNGDAIEAYRNICGEVNATFIPHHFKVEPALVNHNKNGQFTYIANGPNTNFAMAARVELKITAEAEDNSTTTNFKKDAYQNDISVDLNVTDWNTSFVTPAIRLDSNHIRLDADIDVKDIPNALTIDFGVNGEANGTHTIESNGSTPMAQRILFNYARTNNNPKNPFTINGSEANLTVTSRYTTTKDAPEGTADINGTSVASGSVRFYYGRVNPTEYFWKKVEEDNKTTPINLEVYCDISLTNNTQMCNSFGINTDDPGGYINGGKFKWWYAQKHNMANNDGNVTFRVISGNGFVAPAILSVPLGTGIDSNITVSLDTLNNIRPQTVVIDFDTSTNNTTSTWLIFNSKSDTLPLDFEKVEFTEQSVPPGGGGAGGLSNWTGHGKTGNVVETNASRLPNQRLGW